MRDFYPSDRSSRVFSVLTAAAFAAGIAILVLPLHVFLLLAALVLVVFICVSKPEYALFLVILTVVEDMTVLFARVDAVINGVSQFLVEPRFFVFYIPLFTGLIGWIAGRAAGWLPRRRATPLDVVLALIVLYEWISIIWGPEWFYSTAVAFNLLVNFLLYYFITAMIWSPAILEKAARVWIVAGAISAVGVFASQWIDIHTQLDIGSVLSVNLAFGKMSQRASGFAGHNHVAGFCGMAAAMSMGLALHETRRNRQVLYISLALLMLAAIILTESRGALIGTVVAGVFFVYMHERFKGRFVRSSLVFMFIVVMVVLVVTPGLVDRMLIGFGYSGRLYFTSADTYLSLSEANEAAGIVGTSSRTAWWINGLGEMTTRPWKLITGLGVGGFPYYSKGSPDTNSVILWFFYDMGLFGIIMLVCFAWILIGALRYYIVYARDANSYYLLLAGVTAIVVAPGVHGLIEYDWSMGGSRLVWFPLGFAMAALNMVKAESLEAGNDSRMRR